MAVREIRYYLDPILRQPTKEIERPVDSVTLSEITDMIDTMYSMEAYGVAANQIGISKRMFVIDVDWFEKGIKNAKLLINPTVIEISGKDIPFKEGCLSFPGAFINHNRKAEICVQYMKIDGEIVQETFTGIESFAVQHEMEHLDGKFFIDDLGPVSRQMVIDKAKKTIKKIRRRG